MNIYNLKQDLIEIFEELEENGGELTPELEEALAITQSNFKQKVHNYVNVIKDADSDCAAIDTEIKRLKTLKDSKKKLKERLSKVLCEAIDMFGEHTKSGGAYIDLGTEKISVRNSKKLEVDDDTINEIAKQVVGTLTDLAYNNAIDFEDISIDKFIEQLKEHVKIGENGESISDPINAVPSNFDDISAKIQLNIPLSTLINDDGVEFVKKLTNITMANIVEGTVNKMSLKTELKANNTDHNNIARIIPNQSLIIK